MPRLILIPLLSITAAVIALVGASTAHATYPGHNGLIAFNAVTDGQNQIYTVRPNGHDLRQITHGPGEALVPDWSPDGRQIVFEFDGPNPPPFCSIEIMNADGTGIMDLTGDRNGCEFQPSFTPDGQRIVFDRFDDITFVEAIWSMDLTGGDRHQITTDPDSGGTDPNVSPDGNTLSYVGFEGSGLFSSGLDGSNFFQLLPSTLNLATKHDWAPDGQHLLVTVDGSQPLPGISSNIATVRPDGSGLRYLTHYQGGDVNAIAGSYSPDGQWIVFRLEDHGEYGLYRMRPDGGALHAILPLSSFKPRNIDWGPRTQAGD